ncbi:hypothetical protein SAY87_015283 [Trapa incisa]|uniref:Uncharacterized protein n=1 Tax=Trapa incisa TaxID=236973 RepID=A0AAN7GXG6_9MYRT|nr:hypothetical protein SAY87_015283 [Trapa incisa]
MCIFNLLIVYVAFFLCSHLPSSPVIGQHSAASERGNEDVAISAIMSMRAQLSSCIESHRSSQLHLLSSLQSLVTDAVSSVDRSLKVISAFNNCPFTPTPPLTNHISVPRTHSDSNARQLRPYGAPAVPGSSNSKSLPDLVAPWDSRECLNDENDSPLAIVRSMVAVCLLERVPFTTIDSSTVTRKLEGGQNGTPAKKAALREVGGESGGIMAVEMALRSMAEDNSGVELEEFAVGGKSRVMVFGIDRTRLLKELLNGSRRPQELSFNDGNPSPTSPAGSSNAMPQKRKAEENELKDLEALLNKRSFMEMQKFKVWEELYDLIHRPTAKETAVADKFKTKGGSQIEDYCSALTKEDCRYQSGFVIACQKVHFRRIIAPHTDINLGDCPFLDNCRQKNCMFVHYELDPTPDVPPMVGYEPPRRPLKRIRAEYCSEVRLGEAQWINCDIRSFRMDILGQFGVIMADPPWDINMDLPYGTMFDQEMWNLNVSALQTDGLIFLWVTGRAMELGRDCLELWGYKRVEEIIWVKTNQLQRITVTGRTGHWLNHSKEHCLVGIKGNPEVNRNIDTDVIVSEVRETSRKPDAIYALLERISPGTRKLELFARMHNTHPGWLSLGNQLDGVRLVEKGLRARFKAAYPDIELNESFFDELPWAGMLDQDSPQSIFVLPLH